MKIAAVLARRLAPAAVHSVAVGSWGPAGAGLRRACEELGPAFVKLGQFLSVRPDLVPPSAVAQLEALQDASAPVDAAAVRLVLERELMAPVEALFAQFEWQPLAAASVSQVHRAVLPTGEEVAVKVQRPGAKEQLLRDLDLAGRLVSAVVRLSPLRTRLDPGALVAEVRASCEEELDFRREGEAAEALARILRGLEGVRVPLVHWGWTTRRVLTTEFIDGVKISDAGARGRHDYAAVAERGARAFLCQVLEGGLFHADLHPANLLLTPSGDIAYLDFGIMGTLSPGEREGVLGALAGLLSRDAPLALRHLARLGVHVPRERSEAFAGDLARVLGSAAGRRLADVSAARLGRGLLAAAHRHRVVFPRKYALLVKALLTIEGSARALHPAFSFEEAALGYLREAGRRSLRLGQLVEAGWRGAALVGLGAVTAATPARRGEHHPVR